MSQVRPFGTFAGLTSIIAFLGLNPPGNSTRRRKMSNKVTFDYAIIRVVPRVEREEFLNVGVIVSCPALGFLEARIELEINRLKAFAPTLDIDSIPEYLNTIPTICTGDPDNRPIGQLP